jgi:hypothetical protein
VTGLADVILVVVIDVLDPLVRLRNHTVVLFFEALLDPLHAFALLRHFRIDVLWLLSSILGPVVVFRGDLRNV